MLFRSLKKEKKKIELHIDGEYLAKQIIYIDTNANHTIDAYMNKNEIIGFSHPKAIKKEIVKYKIIEINEGKIKLEHKKNCLLLVEQ